MRVGPFARIATVIATGTVGPFQEDPANAGEYLAEVFTADVIDPEPKAVGGKYRFINSGESIEVLNVSNSDVSSGNVLTVGQTSDALWYYLGAGGSSSFRFVLNADMGGVGSTAPAELFDHAGNSIGIRTVKSPMADFAELKTGDQGVCDFDGLEYIIKNANCVVEEAP